MNVNDRDIFGFVMSYELRRQDAHVADEADEVGREWVDGGDKVLIKLFAGAAGALVCLGVQSGRVGFRDVDGFVALVFGSGQGITVFLVGDDSGELDAGHFSGIHFVDNGLQIGSIGGGEDDDAEGGGLHGRNVIGV